MSPVLLGPAVLHAFGILWELRMLIAMQDLMQAEAT